MARDRLAAAVPDGEALRYETSGRFGRAVGLTDDRLLLVDDETISVAYGDVDEVTAQDADWFVAVMSVGLVGFGVLSLPQNLPAGLVFLAAGLVSLALVYRKRGKVTVRVHTRPKPLSFYLKEPETFLSRLEPLLDEYERRITDGEGGMDDSGD